MTGRRFYQVNHYIQAKKVRVIDRDGRQVGVMATSEALQEAKKQRLDLVEVASKAEPPVCKIIDFKRFIYQEKTRGQEKKKKNKQSGIKQIRLKLFIDDHDLNQRIKKAEGFLKDGSRVQFVIFLRGREITKQDRGFKLLEKTEKSLKEIAEIIQKARIKGRILEVTFKPKKHA